MPRRNPIPGLFDPFHQPNFNLVCNVYDAGHPPPATPKLQVDAVLRPMIGHGILVYPISLAIFRNC